MGKNNAELGKKIQHEQLENGEKIKALFDEFEKLKNRTEFVALEGYDQLLAELKTNMTGIREQVNSLIDGNLNLLDNTYSSDLANIGTRLNNLQNDIHDNYLKKNEEIKLNHLSEELKNILFNPSPIFGFLYQFDKNKEMREIIYRTYLIVANGVINIEEDPLFSQNINITAEEWFGPDYQENIFDNASVQMFYNGTIYDYISEEDRVAADWYSRLLLKINRIVPSVYYIPRTGIDVGSNFSPIPTFESVNYNPESKQFTFASGDTVEHIFSVVKFK